MTLLKFDKSKYSADVLMKKDSKVLNVRFVKNSRIYLEFKIFQIVLKIKLVNFDKSITVRWYNFVPLASALD